MPKLESIVNKDDRGLTVCNIQQVMEVKNLKRKKLNYSIPFTPAFYRKVRILASFKLFLFFFSFCFFFSNSLLVVITIIILNFLIPIHFLIYLYLVVTEYFR